MEGQEKRLDEGEVGDVEAAGETTAADAVQGPAHTKAVGEGTMVRVEGEGEQTDPGRK